MTPFTADFWLLLAFGILWIAGVWTAFKPEMILGPLGDRIEFFLKAWFENGAAEMIVKPLFTCPPCMSSFWGAPIWLLAGGSWEMLLPFVVCLCGANAFLFIVFAEK